MEKIKVERFVVGLLQTNCYLVYDSLGGGGFLIDPGVFSKKISERIKEKGIRIKNIINTHGHPDHTSGNDAFGYPVLIHRDDDGTLKDGDVIKEGAIVLQVIHTPGHTPGSICLKMSPDGFSEGSIIFTGDTLFQGGVGRTDLPGGSQARLTDSIEHCLMGFPDETKIFPGHGPDSTIGEERKWLSS